MMHTRKIVFSIALGLTLLAGSLPLSHAYAEEGNEKRIYTRTTTGIIRNIYPADHEAIISGYRYYFGNPVYGDASEVRMYGYDAGSFEMLRVGMKVRVEYAEYGHIRYVTELKELSPNALNVEG